MSEIEHNYECYIVKQTSPPVLMIFFNTCSSINIWYLLCKIYSVITGTYKLIMDLIEVLPVSILQPMNVNFILHRYECNISF